MNDSVGTAFYPRVGAPLVHVHIPKTAGSTFNSILRALFPKERIYEYFAYFNDSGCDGPAISAALREKSIFLGHMDMRCLPLLPRETMFVSFLRDPVDRVVSGYYNILRDPSNPAHRDVKGMDISTYLDSGLVRDVDNGQVRRLAGVGMDAAWGSMTAKHLALARSNIDENRFFIGITERFDESLILLHQSLGTKMTHYVSVNVRRVTSESVPTSIREHILALNPLDAALYKEYSANFGQRLAEILELSSRLRLFNREQRFYRIKTLPSRWTGKLINRLCRSGK
jgi:hypothetical protein